MKDSFKLGNKEFNSRFILGSGKYSNELINSAINYAGAEIVTVAMRRAVSGIKENIFNHSSGIFIILKQIGPNIRSKKPPITDAGIKVVWKNFILALKKVPKIRNKPNNPKEFNKSIKILLVIHITP